MDRHSDVGKTLEELLECDVASSEQLGGGDFAAAYRVELANGKTVFAKTHADPPPHFFGTEAAGLSWLRAPGAVKVPEVLAVSDTTPLLVLEWIDENHRRLNDEAAFGRALAALHLAGATCFGREDGRTTGSRALPNTPCDTWVEFYASRRLVPLIRLAFDAGIYSSGEIAIFDAAAARLSIVGGPGEPPARLHGDLWAGNRIVDSAGDSWLIDPACHGGHREFDLAMMRLFGGFGFEAFDAYEEIAPLADGWTERIELHQLAPLLVHAIKFGGGYVSAALGAARRYL